MGRGTLFEGARTPVSPVHISPLGGRGFFPLRGGRPAPRLFHVFQRFPRRTDSPKAHHHHSEALTYRLVCHAKEPHATETTPPIRCSTSQLRGDQEPNPQQKNSRAGRHEVRNKSPPNPLCFRHEADSREQRRHARAPRGSREEAHATTARHETVAPTWEDTSSDQQRKGQDNINVLFVGGNVAPFFWVGGPCSLRVLMAKPPPSL